VGFALYADFRPDVSGWGKRGELKCETLLGLRKKGLKGEPGLSSGSSGAAITHTQESGRAAVKHEALDKDHSVLDDASDGTPVDKESGLEPNNLFNASFDEFTAEELSGLP